MRRRDLVLIAATLLFSLRTARAQQRERVRRVGYLTPATGSPEDVAGVEQIRALVDGLRQFGWVDGRNIAIEHHFSGSGRERIVATAKELVRSRPDLIVTPGSQTTEAVLAETREIPVVFTIAGDPVEAGYVASLARPGSNATGLAAGEPAAGAWIDLLKEIAPGITRMMALVTLDTPQQQKLADALAAAAPAAGVSLVIAPVRAIADYESQLAGFATTPGGGLVMPPNPIASINRERITALALRYRLPAVYSFPTYARSGGLISYGPDNIAMLRDAARYIDKILRGTNPGDLPVDHSARLVLTLNLRTARAIGLAVPPSLLARADTVLE